MASAGKQRFSFNAKKTRLWAMILLALGLIGVAVASQGFDVQNLKLNSQNIWILQKGAGERYGAVNTTLSELTSANAIPKPDGLIQSQDSALLFAAGESRFAAINQANPEDFTDEPGGYLSAPKNLFAKDIEGNRIAFIGGSNRALYLSNIENGKVSEPTIVPMPNENKTALRFDAVTIASDGDVYVFSLSDFTVRSYSPVKNAWTNLADKVSGLEAGKYQIASIGSKWALLHVDTGKIWVSGSKKVSQVEVLGDPWLQESSPDGGSAFVASESGLSEINLDSGKVRKVAEVSGKAAKPVWFNQAIYAAWVTQSSAGGYFYSSATGKTESLAYGGKSLASMDSLEPVIQSNGSTAVVNETQSGWAWRLPDGALIKSTQNWDLTKQKKSEQTGTIVEPVTEPRSPIAEDDSFGVRPGTLVALPVLLNDHDPNEDVLAIDPASLSDLGGFGTVRVSNDGQMIVVDVSSSASGGATIRYKATDGTANDGRKSGFASVRLSVVGGNGNTAPQWCSDVMDKCLQDWPSPQVQPGGSVSVQALTGWVDREGDRMFISGVDVAGAAGTAGFTSDGFVVFKSKEDATKSGSVNLTVHISDIRGGETTKSLTVNVTPKPELRLTPFAVTTAVNHEVIVDISRAVSGASGNVLLTSAKPQKASDATVSITGPTTFKIKSGSPEQVIVQYSVNDDSGTAASFVRVNIVNVDTDTISSNPVTVLVSPGLDTSIDLFAATMNPAGKALVISDIQVKPYGGSSLYAEKTRNGIVLFRGETASNLPGYLGVVTYKVSDGSTNSRYSATGQAFVYRLPDPTGVNPIAVTDQVVIRAGEVMDVDVLANDVGELGLPLRINQSEVKPDCLEGGLVFANAGKLRVVAPKAAGRYVCSYSIYSSGSPSVQDKGDVVIQVIATGSNTPPEPVELYGRVNAGESVKIVVPLQSMDADGDVVSLTAVGATTYSKGYASLSPERNAIIFTARPNESGQDEFTYTVTDANGAKGTGVVHVGVLNAETNIAPVAMVDFAELVAGAGSKTVIDPISNDFDPRDEVLTLVKGSVKPDAPAGSNIYDTYKNAIAKISGNSITFKATEKPMTLHYTYRVTNKSGSISEGSIVVKVAAKASIYYPEISDTYVSLADLGTLQSPGIEVVKKKVIWPAGDVSKLRLSIWGDGRGLSASGTKIKGTAPQGGGVVVFKLEGEDFAGNTVAGYGLLHLPNQNNFLLTLDPNKARQEVKEKSSVTFDMAELIVLPPNVRIELDASKLKTLGVRQAGACTASGTKVTYTAGVGEPWEDGCVVAVRRAGTYDYSELLVPITIIPEKPEPLLSKSQVTVNPGPSSAIDFDLTTITTWVQHQNDIKNLKYSHSYSGSHFKVSLNGTMLHIEALANVDVGVTDEVTISLPDHSATKPTTLTLVMGKSPNENPLGGTISLECHGRDGSCDASVSDAQGTYNAFEKEKALDFAPFNYSLGTPNYSAKSNLVTCPGRPDIKFVATASKITVTWDKKKSPSAACRVTYRVLDKEGASGPGELTFTLMGVPDQLGSVRQIGYGKRSVTLEIEAGNAGRSEPPIQGYRVFEGKSKIADCPLKNDGESVTVCRIGGLDPYDGKNKDNIHTYTVYAFNDEGDAPTGRDVSKVYAYVPPKRITADIFVKVESKYSGLATAGLAKVTISPLEDPLVTQYEISSEAGGSPVKHVLEGFGNFTEEIPAKPGLASRITVRAIASVPPPGVSVAPEASATWTGRIAGAPSVSGVTASVRGDRSPFAGNITATANRGYSPYASKVAYILWSGATKPGCTFKPGTGKDFSLTVSNAPEASTLVVTDTDGDIDTQSASISSGDMKPLKDFSGYKSLVCYSNGFGIVKVDGNEISTLGDPNDGDFTFVVGAKATDLQNGAFAWLVELKDSKTQSDVYPEFNGSKSNKNDWRSTIYSEYYGEPSVIKVRYCTTKLPKACSAGERLVTAADDTRAWQLKVNSAFLADANGNQTPTCNPGENLIIGLSGEGLGDATMKNWTGGEPGQGTAAKYQLNGNWMTFSTRGSAWKLPANASGTNRIRLYIKGNNLADGPIAVRGLTTEHEIEFAVNCN